MECKFVQKWNIVKIIFSGLFNNLKQSNSDINIAKTFADHHNCRHLLCDVRAMRVTGSITDLYNAGKNLADTGLDRSYRIALICQDNGNQLEFFELVAHNRGYQIHCVANETDGVNWLLKTA